MESNPGDKSLIFLVSFNEPFLLKRTQDLTNQRKNLFIENPEEDFELCEYNVAVEEHIFWQDQVALVVFNRSLF